MLRKLGTAATALVTAGAMITVSGTPAEAYTPRFSFAGIADWDHDGSQDLLARDALGRLWLYPGDSERGPGSQRRALIGQRFTNFSLAGPVDWDGDGHVDLLVRDARGNLLLLIGESSRDHTELEWARLGRGFGGWSVAGMADWDADDHVDLVARDPGGRLWLFPGESERGPSSQRRVLLGAGFGGYAFAGVADWDADGHVDLVARDPRGRLWLYPGDSERGPGSERRVLINHGFGGWSLPDVADWDADGNVDLMARDTQGRMWLYPGDSSRGYSGEERVFIGRGW